MFGIFFQIRLYWIKKILLKLNYNAYNMNLEKNLNYNVFVYFLYQKKL